MPTGGGILDEKSTADRQTDSKARVFADLRASTVGDLLSKRRFRGLGLGRPGRGGENADFRGSRGQEETERMQI